MPVTLVRYWGSYYKSERQAVGSIRWMHAPAAAGWSIHLVCDRPPSDEAWLMPYTRLGVRFHYLPRPRSSFDATCARRAYALFRQLRADIMHCDNIHTTPMMGATMARVPVRIWSKRSMQPVFEEMREPTFRDRLAPAVRTSCALATRIHTVSQAVKNELIEMGIPDRKVVVIENPVDPLLIRPNARTETRARLNVQPDDVLFSTLGRSVPVKGWDTLLRAFARVAREAPRARLILGGSTTDAAEQEHFGRLQRLVLDAGLSDSVQFIGFVADIGALFAATDVFVLPSRSEGNANVLLQSLASGVPSISTRVGNAPQLVRPDDNGFMVERDDPEQLAGAMLRLYHDPDRRARMGRAARAHLNAPSVDQSNRRLFELYEGLLYDRHPPVVTTPRQPASDSPAHAGPR